jgi:hypothetical protein
VFTARYELSRYIEQTCLVFKGLNICPNVLHWNERKHDGYLSQLLFICVLDLNSVVIVDGNHKRE